MIKLRKDCVSLPHDKPVTHYNDEPDELYKSLDSNDGHWVTVKAEGPLHGRHLFISGDGRVLKGKGVPAHVVAHLNGKGKHHLEGAQAHNGWKPSMKHAEAHEWAKDSKVKDVVYHGTSAGAAANIKNNGFKIESTDKSRLFGTGAYFAGKAGAERWSKAVSKDGVAVPVRLNIKNPLDIGGPYSPEFNEFKEKAMDRFADKPQMLDSDKMTAYAKELGHDGFKAKEWGHDIFVAFDPEQIAHVEDEAEPHTPETRAQVLDRHEEEIGDHKGKGYNIKKELEHAHGMRPSAKRTARIAELGKQVAAHQEAGQAMRERHDKELESVPRSTPKPPEKHEMTSTEFRAANPGMHPETARVQWMSALRQAVHEGGKEAIPRRVFDEEKWLEPYIDNGWKTPREPKAKIAGEGHPFSKEQNEKNNKFLEHASMAFHPGQIGGGILKDVRAVLHKEGYAGALKFIDTHSGRSWDSMKMSGKETAGMTSKEYMEKLAAEHKATGEGYGPDEIKPEPLPKYWAGPTDEKKHAAQQAKKLQAGDHVQLSQSAMDYLHEQHPELKGKIQDKAIINSIDKNDDPEWTNHNLMVFDHEHNIVSNQFPARAKELKFHWRHDPTPSKKELNPPPPSRGILDKKIAKPYLEEVKAHMMGHGVKNVTFVGSNYYTLTRNAYNIASHMDLLHNVLGDTHVPANLSIEIRSGENARAAAEYDMHAQTIRVFADGKSTFMHEYGHYIDNMLVSNFGEKKFPKHGVGGSGAHSGTDSPLAGVLDDIMNSEEHKRQYPNPKRDTNTKYKTREEEVFARFFSNWVQHEARKNGVELPADVTNGDNSEPYKPETYDRIGAKLREVLQRHNLSKSLVITLEKSFDDTKHPRDEWGKFAKLGADHPETREYRSKLDLSQSGAFGNYLRDHRINRYGVSLAEFQQAMGATGKENTPDYPYEYSVMNLHELEPSSHGALQSRIVQDDKLADRIRQALSNNAKGQHAELYNERLAAFENLLKEGKAERAAFEAKLPGQKRRYAHNEAHKNAHENGYFTTGYGGVWGSSTGADSLFLHLQQNGFTRATMADYLSKHTEPFTLKTPNVTLKFHPVKNEKSAKDGKPSEIRFKVDITTAKNKLEGASLLMKRQVNTRSKYGNTLPKHAQREMNRYTIAFDFPKLLSKNALYAKPLDDDSMKDAYTYKHPAVSTKDAINKTMHLIIRAIHADTELSKSLTDLKKGNHALVIPRKVAPVEVASSPAEDLGEKYLTLYHTTPTRNVASIMQSGLIPRHGKPTQGENPAYNAVYFHTDAKKAIQFDPAYGGPQEPKSVLAAKVPLNSDTARRLRPDEDTFHKTAAEAVSAKDGVAYCGHIPPEWIHKKHYTP